MTAGTVRLHRVLRAPPARVYRAFIDPDALVKWLPPHGFTCKVQPVDARVGGGFRMSFTNFCNLQSHTFGGEYLELILDQRLRYSDKFDDPAMPGVMITTVDLRAVTAGTEVSIIQEGIPESIPVEMCYLGWQESLCLLKQLVEAEVSE